MKRKNIVGLIVIVAIAAVVIFAGCIEEKPIPTPIPTPTSSPSPFPLPSPTPSPSPSLTPSPTPTPIPTPTLAVTITAPNDGDTVSRREIVKGTSEGVYNNPERNIYVLIYPIEAGGPWWVQPDVGISHDGSWEVNCYFGREPPQDRGARFRVCAIITTQKLSEGQQWQKIPEYVVKSETIEVIRG